MKLRKVLSTFLFSCLICIASIGFASPASDALAQEDAVAMPLADAIFHGEKDFSRFAPYVDTKMLGNVNEFSKATKDIKDLSKVEQIFFVGFERGTSADVVSYVGLLPGGQSGYLFAVIFDPNTGLVIGSAINGLTVK